MTTIPDPVLHLAGKYRPSDFPDLHELRTALERAPVHKVYGLRAVGLEQARPVGETPLRSGKFEGGMPASGYEDYAAAVLLVVPPAILSTSTTAFEQSQAGPRLERNVKIAMRALWQYAYVEASGDTQRRYALLVLGGDEFVPLDSGDFDVGMLDSRVVYAEVLGLRG